MKKRIGNIDESLRYSVKDGIAASVTGGAGDNFISAYAVALGATNFQLGLLTAIANVIPGELFTAKAMEKYSRKQILLFGVLIQAMLWLPIALISVVFLKSPSLAPLLLIIFYTAYAFFGWFLGPAWSSWMKSLTEGKEKGKYFGMRNRISGFAGLITAIIAGLILDWFKSIGEMFIGFGVLFVIACMARMISRVYLAKQYEPKLKLHKGYYFSFWQFLKKAPENNYGRFAIFISLINFAVAISSPFFTPYLLRDLNFNYFTFILINLVIQTSVALMMMPVWGRFSDKYGNVKMLRMTAWFVPLIPLMWVLSSSVYWLAFTQVVAGIVWAGFNLSAANFTYDAVTKERMGLCNAYVIFLSGISIFLGSLLGGLLASLNITFMNVFLFVFLVSSIIRFVVVLAMARTIKEVRPIECFNMPHPIKVLDIVNPIKAVHSLVDKYYNDNCKKR